jgi:hypothetical protein
VPAGSAVSDKNPAENQKIESEKPVLPGIPGQVPQKQPGILMFIRFS